MIFIFLALIFYTIAILLGTLASRSADTNFVSAIKEIILATNPTMEGDATAMYIAKQLRILNKELRITRIGRGLPIGADIEYADDMTLKNAMEKGKCKV